MKKIGNWNFSPLRFLLMQNKSLDPFHKDFNRDNYLKEISEKVTVDELIKDVLHDTVRLLNVFNEMNDVLHDHISKQLYSCNLTPDDLFETAVVVFNRNYLVGTKQLHESTKDRNEFRQTDYYSYKIPTVDPGIGRIEMSSALEADIDALNFLLNLLPKLDKTKWKPIDNAIPPVHTIEIIGGVSMAAVFLQVIKEMYHESIWSGGSWTATVNDSEILNTIYLNYPDREILVLNKVGFLRLQTNITTNYFYLNKAITQQNYFGKMVLYRLLHHKKDKSVSGIVVENGIINYTLADTRGHSSFQQELMQFAAVSTYYPFMEDVALPQLNDLSLIDIIKMFCAIQALIQAAAELEFDDELSSAHDIHRFPYKIHSDRLASYLTETTTYTPTQIARTIDLFSSSFGEHISLWKKPLIRRGQYLYLAFLPVLQGISLKFMDQWLEEGGYDLDRRGKLMEKWLKNECVKTFQKKSLNAFIPTSSTFRTTGGASEEIDLVLNLKTVVLVAELKCIKYPFETRDRHNTIRRLGGGVQQVLRKIKFLKEHADDLKTQLGEVEGKEFIPLVITNYPIYTGYEIEHVPITDFYLFESYFKSGEYRQEAISGTTVQIIKSARYYTNEDEMNNNLKTFFTSAPSVKEIKDQFVITRLKMSPEKWHYEIYTDSAQFK